MLCNPLWTTVESIGRPPQNIMLASTIAWAVQTYCQHCDLYRVLGYTCTHRVKKRKKEKKKIGSWVEFLLYLFRNCFTTTRSYFFIPTRGHIAILHYLPRYCTTSTPVHV